MNRRILKLGRALREAGAPVSTAEILDAARAALAVGVSRRNDLRTALCGTLVKHREHRAEFDAQFERHFPAGIPGPRRRPRDKGQKPGGGGSGTGGHSERRGPGGAQDRSSPAACEAGARGRSGIAEGSRQPENHRPSADRGDEQDGADGPGREAADGTSHDV